ncbi:MAG: ATP-binding protein [Burkholderiales bacterium]
MKRWWASWFGDTLFRRLFLLMWVALVASQLLAYAITTQVHAPPEGARPGGAPLAALPSLPPMGALSPPPDGMRDGGPPPGPPPADGRGGPRPPGDSARPAGALWLDYFVRFVAIGVAAWFGARWLSAPMRQLADASEGLSNTLGDGRPTPPLDERRGTLEVRRAAQVFNAMARRLRAQFDAQSLLMAAISHDLRTPLARLRMRLETMDEQAQTQRCVADVREMDTLIGSVLGMMRDSHERTERERVDVTALAQSLVDDLAEQSQPASMAADAPAAIVLAQPAALQRVLGNLIGNALRYGGAAAVSIEVSAIEVQLFIDDSGPGISPDQLDAVFQPFYRIDPSRGRGIGSVGLGLYIARDLAQRNGGRLTLANRAEGGLRATLTLPPG